MVKWRIWTKLPLLLIELTGMLEIEKAVHQWKPAHSETKQDMELTRKAINILFS
jgi:hypothetical protein